MGSSLPMRRASPSRAERPRGSLVATGKKWATSHRLVATGKRGFW